MPIACFRFLPIMCAWLAMLPGAVRAQDADAARSGGDVTSALGSQATEKIRAGPEHHELRTDKVSATVTVLRSGRPFPAGGSAFAQIRLSNETKSRRVTAELVLETETAVIRDVSGNGLAVSQDGDARIARIEKIAKGKPRMVIVEVGLREAGRSAEQGEQQNRLKVTLRQPGTPGQTATLDWSVADCAGGFYSQIVKVREGSGAGIADAIKAARSKDRTRPGRWLFPPRSRTAKATRKCVRRARRWSSGRGRYVYRCTKYQTVGPAVTAAAAPVESERSIFRFASTFVRSRAMDRELAQTRDSGWAAQRVSQNLRGFLKQDSNPALCTGVIPFFNYFDKRMAGFAKRAEKFDEMAAKSFGLARLRSSEAKEAVKADPGGHPGWGAAPLDLPPDTNEATLKSQIEDLARLTGEADLQQRITDTGSVFEALRAMSVYFESEAAKSVSASTRATLYRALSSIEAADYIGTVASHYADLRHALLGSMSTIRQAHASNCTCGG